MRRLVRGLAFSLVLAPNLAGAECSWVVWKQTIAPVQSWDILQAHPMLSACSEELARWTRTLKEAGYSVTPGARMITFNHKSDMGYMFCLPDTIDPRAPKGGQP